MKSMMIIWCHPQSIYASNGINTVNTAHSDLQDFKNPPWGFKIMKIPVVGL